MTQVHETATDKKVAIGPAGVKLCEALLDAATGFGKLDKSDAPRELYQYIAEAVYETAPRVEGEVDVDEFVDWGKRSLDVLIQKTSQKVRDLGGGDVVDLIDEPFAKRKEGPSVH
jgi:hypothetical protein